MDTRSTLRFFLASLGFTLLAATTFGGCDDGSSGDCPGIVCTDCSASGDCAIDPCPAGQSEFCGNFGYFGDDDTARCAFCEAPDFQP
jgi:hypothetical protein